MSTQIQHAAAVSRMKELRSSIAAAGHDSSQLERRLAAVQEETALTVRAKEAELEAILRQDEAEKDLDLRAEFDKILHFQESANQLWVSKMMAKDDQPLAQAEDALRRALVDIADIELKRREDELRESYDAMKKELLKLDEDSYSAKVQAAYIRHKEIMATLS